MGRLASGAFPEASPDALDPKAVADWTGDDVYETRTPPEGWDFGWNHPCCDRCWVFRRGYIQPVRALDHARDGANVCAFCGRPTWARIFLRADPRHVPYPALEDA